MFRNMTSEGFAGRGSEASRDRGGEVDQDVSSPADQDRGSKAGQSDRSAADRDRGSKADLSDRSPADRDCGRDADPDVSSPADRDCGGEGERPGDRRRERVDLTDPKAMRALAHPLRWALLEALAQAGTLTATQASEMLNESPANCAFHLRTLAKYGFVQEAGGGRGRERPWRRAHAALHITSEQDDPTAVLAARELGNF